MDKIILNVKAKDNHGYQYDVFLRPSEYLPGETILCIDKTGAQWRLKDLKPIPEIFIDLGQDWRCVNFLEVLAAAHKAI